MSHLYYLVGAPGSGKRTVGKELSALTGAALLDNHLTNDPVFLAAGISGNEPVSDEVWALCFAVRQAIRTATLHAPPTLAHILTNYLTAQDQEWMNVERLRQLATARGGAVRAGVVDVPTPGAGAADGPAGTGRTAETARPGAVAGIARPGRDAATPGGRAGAGHVALGAV